MKARTTLLLILTLCLVVGSALAIKSGDITINSPADAAWTNLTNYTSGFNFSWSDASADYGATCTLYIGTDNNVPLILATANGSYASASVAESTDTTLYMNHTFPVNNTRYYWLIQCGNSTATPSFPSTATTPRALYQDVEMPTCSITGVGFTNNTWQSTSSIRMELKPTDAANLYGSSLTCSVANSSNNYAFASGTTSNNTAVNVTWTAPDGQYNITGLCKDPALNTKVNGTVYTVKIDTTAPVLTHNSPANNYLSSVNWILLNWSITEQNLEAINLEWDGTNASIGTGNCTGTAPNHVCTYNKTGISAKNDITYKIFANDSAGTWGVSSTRTVTVDLGNPTVTTTYNFTVASSVATYKLLITDTTPTTCVAKVYQRNGSDTGNTLTGSLSVGASTSNCTGTFTGSDIGVEGDFRIEFNVTDEAGNSVQANKTGVYKELYSGWNVLTYTGSARNASTICGEISGCTKVSYINNTANGFVTYSTTTPTVNAGTNVNAGDAILVYLSADADFLADDYLPTSAATGENITLYDGGWNGFGITLDSNLSAVYNAVTFGGSDKNISYAAKYDASAGSFYTCKRSTNLCAGTSTLATNIPLVKGDAAWVLTDLNANYTINRTGVTG